MNEGNEVYINGKLIHDKSKVEAIVSTVLSKIVRAIFQHFHLSGGMKLVGFPRQLYFLHRWKYCLKSQVRILQSQITGTDPLRGKLSVGTG